MQMKPTIRLSLMLIIGSLVFSACSQFTPKPDPVALTATVVALTPAEMPATHTPLTPLSILIVPPGADQVLADELENEMRGLAEDDGLRFQVRPSLSLGELAPELEIVVAIPPDPGLVALAQAAPATQFISIGVDGITTTENLSTIRSQTYDTENLAFIAGFIAGVITPDWRAGILLPAEQTSATQIQLAFSNGLHYWCGLCQPSYAPFIIYPQSAQVIDPADSIAALSTVDTLVNLGVKTIYVPADVSTTALLEYMAQKQLMMIGVSEPPDSVAALWVVSLRAGSPLESFKSLWADVSSGIPGADIEIPLDLLDTEAGLLGESRQRVIREMLGELSSGLINIGLVPD
jgi:hypothetical protein